MRSRAQFIVLEGPDGSGTTHHSTLLAERMQRMGTEVVLTAEPSSGPIGAMIRSMLQSGEIPSPPALQLLFCADRADHVERVIAPALTAGKTVITDRYALSTIVYGAAQGLPGTWLESLNAPFLVPDRTILLLPPYAVLTERIRKRKQRDHFEEDTLQRAVYDGYSAVQDPNVMVVDSSGSIEDVAEEIWKKLRIEN